MSVCKYCGAVKIGDVDWEETGYTLYECLSQSFDEGSWLQSAECSNSQEKLVISPDEYHAAVVRQIPTSWLWPAEDNVIEVLRRCGVSVDDAVQVITEVWEGKSNGD
jgi:hypothetical protein